MSWPRARRGSEGSERDDAKHKASKTGLQHAGRGKGRLAFRSSSEEGQRKRRINAANMDRREIAERLLDQAVASFDASAIPERPKSACENSYLCQVEHLYGLGTETVRNKEGRNSDEGNTLPAKKQPSSRDSSKGRTRSADRNPQMSKGPNDQIFNKVRPTDDIVKYTQPPPITIDLRRDNVYATTSIIRRPVRKKENIYENVISVKDASGSRVYLAPSLRPTFKKQNSLDTLPSHLRDERTVVYAESSYERKESIRKADSFEGHEEAVRSLVAQVQKNRILRRKETK